MKHLTLEDFRPFVRQFSHEGHLTPSEASRLQLLIMDHCCDASLDKYLLKFLSRFLTPESYTELSQERTISKLCAYPLCSLAPGRIKDAYSNSYHQSQLLPYSYLNSFCSKQHYQCSEFYKAQLTDESLFARKDVTCATYGELSYEKVALLEEVLDSSYDGPGPSLLDVIKRLDSLKLGKTEETQELAGLLADIKIVEKHPQPPTMYEYLEDQSKAINGNRLSKDEDD